MKAKSCGFCFALRTALERGERSMTHRKIHAAFVSCALLSAGLGGFSCRSSTDKAPTLGTIKTPPSFTFATSAPVAVEVAAEPGTLGEADAAALDIQLPDGRILYQGPLRVGKQLNLRLSIPTKDKELRFRVRGIDLDRTSTVAIAAGRASHTFR
jgi:hypothetical protein